MLKATVKENTAFLLPYFALSTLAAVALLLNDKYNLQLALNQYNTPFFDRFFSFFTHLGEAYVVLAVLIVALCQNFKTGLQYACSYALGGILILSGKHLVFADFNRPLYYFENTDSYHFIEGVSMNMYHSFPSGHTQAGFTAFFFLCLMLKKPSLKFICFVFALLVAYSRVYLSQHFVSDILVGSLIAIASCIAVQIFFKRWKWETKRNLISVLKIAIAGRRK